MQCLNIINISLLTIRLLIKRYLYLLNPIKRQHLLPLQHQILHIHIAILEIPLHIQRMRQLILNNRITQEPNDSVQLIDLELDVVEGRVDVDDAVVL